MMVATLMQENYKQCRLSLPLLTHGNLHQSLNLYKATLYACDIEKGSLKMTEFVYKVGDGADVETIATVQYLVCEC